MNVINILIQDYRFDVLSFIQSSFHVPNFESWVPYIDNATCKNVNRYFLRRLQSKHTEAQWAYVVESIFIHLTMEDLILFSSLFLDKQVKHMYLKYYFLHDFIFILKLHVGTKY